MNTMIMQQVKKGMKRFFLSIIGIVIVLLVLGSLKVIDAGERGVLLTTGKASNQILEPGLHFKLPIIQKIVLFDVKTMKVEVSAASASRDLQDVNTAIALNFHLDPSRVDAVYKEIGTNYQDRIIAPAIQESVKMATAQFTADELITKREEVKRFITDELRVRLEKNYIIVDEFSIMNFEFSPSYAKSIEEKQVADQNAKKAKNDLERVKIEAQQKIEESKGNAEAIRIESEALKQNPELLQLRSIEKWDGKLPLYTSGESEQLFPFLEVQQQRQAE